jgi:hypothetical protein
MYTIRLSCQILIRNEYYAQNFEKHSDIIFHEHLYSGSRVVPCGQTDGPTDVTNLMVASRNFAKALQRLAADSIFYIKSIERPKVTSHIHIYTYAYKITNLSAEQSCSQLAELALRSTSKTRLVTLGICAEFQSEGPTATTQCKRWTHQLSVQVDLRHLVSKAHINKGFTNTRNNSNKSPRTTLLFPKFQGRFLSTWKKLAIKNFKFLEFIIILACLM